MAAATKKKMTTSRRRPSKYKIKPQGQHSKDVLKSNLERIIRELESVKIRNGGKIPYGSISAIVQQMQHVLPWLTKEMIQNKLRKKPKPALHHAGQRHTCTIGELSDSAPLTLLV
jgi:hypothetical protein